MSRIVLRSGILAVVLLAGFAGMGQTQSPVVRAVLLYSPTCSHCHQVMTEALPPLRERYGAQLEILEVNVQEPAGSAVYQAAVEQFNPAVRGVPMLIIGDQVLVGSVQIPDRLPALIESYLAAGGVDWPALPDLPGVPIETPPTVTPTPSPILSPTPASPAEKAPASASWGLLAIAVLTLLALAGRISRLRHR